MSHENEFDKTNGEFSEVGADTSGRNLDAINPQENGLNKNISKTELDEYATEKTEALHTPEYRQIDAEISETFSAGASIRKNSSEPEMREASSLPENQPEQEKVQSCEQNKFACHTEMDNTISSAPESVQPPCQSSGIRYNTDTSDKKGSYTWNYCDGAGDDNVNTHQKSKSKKGFVVFMAAAMAFLLVGTATLSAVITSNFIKRSRAYTEAETQEAGKPVIGHKNDGTTQQMVQVPETVLGESLTKQQIAVKCKPSSVGIEVTTTTTSGFYGYSYQSRGVGSGFILTEDGYIATNHHVVDGANEITVQLDDGTKYDATLVGSDSITDLAVLKIEASGLIPMEIGDSDKMVVGDSVVAIGTPAGIEFAGTVTDGIISAINRDVEITNERGTVVKTMTLMQTNAAINPGNSGGPLINDKGEVIGINTLKLTSTYEGIGFSIPINSAVKIFNQLISYGKVSEYDNSFVTGNGAIGITQYAEVSKQEAQYYGIPEGIIIIQIQNTSSAMSAGLRRGDIIIGFCGDKVTTVDELNRLKSKYRAGDEVTLRIYRDGEGERDITFRLDMMQS